MAKLQQSLTDLQSLFDGPASSRPQVTKKLGELKLQLAQSGLYFAPPTAPVDDLVAARSILELGAFHSLRLSNISSYQSYNSSLTPFYALSHLPPSPNRPVILGLHLLALISQGQITQFHTLLETLKPEELSDMFVRLPVDLERWLMEGAYNKVYRARNRVPREEFAFLLEKLMGTVRSQIAATIEASYPSLALQNASQLLFFKQGESSQLQEFANTRGWILEPSSQTFTFPSSQPIQQQPLQTVYTQDPVIPSASADAVSQGVIRGVPMRTMVGPALRLAQQLEAIV